MIARIPPAHRGFTLVEILAALAFMAILIPAVITALTLANRAAVQAERTEIAAQLAEYQLGQLMTAGLWQSAGNRGDFGAQYPNYRWELEQSAWSYDNNNPLTQLTMHVYFMVQGRERDVQITTLANSTLVQQQLQQLLQQQQQQ